jgi:septin family protein
MQALRMTTREVLYERYRTEKLLEKQKAKGGQRYDEHEKRANVPGKGVRSSILGRTSSAS